MNRKVLVVILCPTTTQKQPKVLLLKTNASRGAFWQPVTGKVEENETFMEGALREAFEETGFSFGQAPQYLGIETSFDSRFGPAHEKAFLLRVDQEFAPRLDPNEHQSFRWVNVSEALDACKFEWNRIAIKAATSSPIFLSSRGDFYQDEEEITHENTRKLFHRSIVVEEQTYLLRVGNQTSPLVVEDTPKFVVSYNRLTGQIRLSDGTLTALVPDNCYIRSDNACIVKLSSGLEAKFLASAFYELMKNVEEVSGEYFLHLLGGNYKLRVSKQ